MSISEKIKAINNRIEQNKGQYDLHRQTAKISVYVLHEKYLLEKAATIKGFENSWLGKELKKQINVTDKKQQKFENVFECNKMEEVKKKKMG